MTIELVPLGWLNLPSAAQLAMRIFPQEAWNIFTSLAASLLPAPLRHIVGGATIDEMGYYLAAFPGKKGQAVGMTGLYTLQQRPKEIWLGWYGVEPRRRGCGIGRAVLKASIDLAQNHASSTLRLWTTDNPLTVAATKLYREFGFIPQNTGYAYYGRAVIVYSLALERQKITLAPSLPDHFAGAVRRHLRPQRSTVR
jgi:GNAT superfamily N-acetyltransferase